MMFERHVYIGVHLPLNMDGTTRPTPVNPTACENLYRYHSDRMVRVVHEGKGRMHDAHDPASWNGKVPAGALYLGHGYRDNGTLRYRQVDTIAYFVVA